MLCDDCLHATICENKTKGNCDWYMSEKEIRPTGEWIDGENGNIKCNQCGCEIRYSYFIGNKPDFPKFCCDCGAKMKGYEKNEDSN